MRKSNKKQTLSVFANAAQALVPATPYPTIRIVFFSSLASAIVIILNEECTVIELSFFGYSENSFSTPICTVFDTALRNSYRPKLENVLFHLFEQLA